jgi:hypothetical protein
MQLTDEQLRGLLNDEWWRGYYSGFAKGHDLGYSDAAYDLREQADLLLRDGVAGIRNRGSACLPAIRKSAGRQQANCLPTSPPKGRQQEGRS